MLSLDTTQLSVWVSQYFWPLIRILALISTAPVLSEKQINRKVKVGLAVLITFLIAPSLPPVNIPLVSSGAFMGRWPASIDRRRYWLDYAVCFCGYPIGR